MITEAKRSRPRSATPLPELFRCRTAPTRGLTVLSRADRQAIDAALSAVREWAATRDDGPELDESALTVLAAALVRQHIAPLRAELGRAVAELDQARAELDAASAELGERREVERAARVRKEMASERRNKVLREQARVRDGDNCRLCGCEVVQPGPDGPGTAVLDQVAPDVAAGIDNLMTVCKPCRRKRAGKTLEVAGMTLLPVPDAPRVAEVPPVEATPGDRVELVPIANPRTGRRLLALPRAEAVAWAEGILARCRAGEDRPDVQRAIADRAVILTSANMHGAFDPNGYDVYCPKAERVAWANDGFCQYCGATDHERVSA